MGEGEGGADPAVFLLHHFQWVLLRCLECVPSPPRILSRSSPLVSKSYVSCQKPENGASEVTVSQS